MSTPYEVHLGDFSGSLDLLLHLVKEAKMDIADIRLAEITDQYLMYLEEVREVDMDRASDFLETASILLLIKSRALLPGPPAVPEGEENDPEQELLERMRLYAVFQSASGPLRNLEDGGSRYFYKLPEEPPENEEAYIRLSNADTAALREAFLGVLRRRTRQRREPPVHHVAPELFSVPRKKDELRTRIRTGPFSFASLFDAAAPVQEIVVTFMALLELWGAGELNLAQRRPYAAIEVLPPLTA